MLNKTTNNKYLPNLKNKLDQINKIRREEYKQYLKILLIDSDDLVKIMSINVPKIVTDGEKIEELDVQSKTTEFIKERQIQHRKMLLSDFKFLDYLNNSSVIDEIKKDLERYNKFGHDIDIYTAETNYKNLVTTENNVNPVKKELILIEIREICLNQLTLRNNNEAATKMIQLIVAKCTETDKKCDNRLSVIRKFLQSLKETVKNNRPHFFSRNFNNYNKFFRELDRLLTNVVVNHHESLCHQQHFSPKP